MRLVLAAAALFTLAVPAIAQDEAPFPPELLGLLGQWTLQQEDRPGCDITLLNFWGIGGFQVMVPETCTAAPFSDIAAWHIDDATGDLVFVDATRQPVLTLGEMGDGGLYGSSIDTPPQYFLTSVGGSQDGNTVAVSDVFDATSATPEQLAEIAHIAFEALQNYTAASAGQQADATALQAVVENAETAHGYYGVVSSVSESGGAPNLACAAEGTVGLRADMPVGTGTLDIAAADAASVTALSFNASKGGDPVVEPPQDCTSK